MGFITDDDEWQGVALLSEGVFAAFRNPAAHEPRLVWAVSEEDALDVLATLSMIHRLVEEFEDGVRRRWRAAEGAAHG